MSTQNNATLHAVAGKPGAGKSTTARRIAAETGAMLLCEDELLSVLADDRRNVEDHFKAMLRLRQAMAPLIVELLRRNISVVLDFPCNTVKSRVWFRGLFEAAGADHVLHVLDLPDDVCKAQLRRRNETKPDGVYWGDVSEATFAQVAPYFHPPPAEEGFNVRRYGA